MRGVIRVLLTVVMNVLLLVAVLLLARIVIEFFGRLGSADWATQFIDLTAPLVPPLDLGSIVTPYRGTLHYDAGAALVGVLVAEWIVALVRRFAH